MSKFPLVLIIMDGFGLRKAKEGNAILEAKKPNLDRLFKEYPLTSLKCSGEAVGLPQGLMGNSEVGHLNIGAGRVVYQDLTRISKSIRERDFFKNKVLLNAIKNVKKKKSSLHLMGLLSDGGVHSDITHLYALLELAKRNKIEKVYIHALLDGRDTPPRSALTYMKQLEEKIKEIGSGEIITVMGRYYAMDRDKRWDRVEKAYDAMTLGEGFKSSTAAQAVEDAYKRDENDEFVKPTVVEKNGKPIAIMQDGDSVIFYNFRSDRTREITHAIVDRDFTGFKRKKKVKVHFVCMTEYDVTIDAPVAFPQEKLANIFGEVISRAGLKQLRIAETEKYAHVTFFFNGGVEKPFPNEDRILIHSPKVATYDLKPEMSAYEVTNKIVKEIESNKYDVIILNYANCDMVGHTGIMKAAIAAVEAVDTCVGRVVEAVLKKNGKILITADHGNAEEMIDEKTHGVVTAHSTFPVPFCFVSNDEKDAKLKQGILADIAPTMLKLLNIKKPKEMTGNSVILED